MAGEGRQVLDNTGSLPSANPDFVGPATGGKWQPNYDRYAPELGQALRREVEKPIYD